MAEKGPSNRTLERAGAILDTVESGPKLATQIARETGLSLSTTHRLALAMTETEFLSRFENGAFGLGRRIVQTERDALSYAPLWRLASEVGESVQLWVRSGEERVCRVSIDAPMNSA